MPAHHPVMTCAEARRFESARFSGDADGTRVREAIRRAGNSVARETCALLDEIGVQKPPLVVLCGKGRNGADALIAAGALIDRTRSAVVAIPAGADSLCAETKAALAELLLSAEGRARIAERNERVFPEGECLVIDGLTGAGFRPPLTGAEPALIHAANRHPVAVRVAVDMPSGSGDTCDETLFQAHLTVATGIFKKPLLDGRVRVAAGRIRYADIGFFDRESPPADITVFPASALGRLRAPRPSACDKRDFGRLAILGGHRTMPGALLMNTLAALKAGAGPVTAFCPASVHAAFAAAAPEAMWVPAPETEEGSLSPDAAHAVLSRMEKSDALVCGSGLGGAPEAAELIRELLSKTSVPAVLDADALRPEILGVLWARPRNAGPVVLTPHAGEFKRVSGREAGEGFETLREFARETRTIVVHKGPLTRVCDGESCILIPFGGPALARPGSGDLLAGIIGALLARSGNPGIEDVATAAAWHGAAADHIARRRGAVSLRTTEFLEGLGPCLAE